MLHPQFHKTVCLSSDTLSSESRMAGMSRRKYEQRARAAAAGQTRPRLLDAMLDLLRRVPPEGVSVDEAADVLWTLTSFDAFDLLYTGRSLSPAAVADRLIATAERALLQ